MKRIPKEKQTPDSEQTTTRRAALDPAREARIAVLERYMTPERRSRLEHAVLHRRHGVAAVVDGIHDLGNASAIMRTCDGLGIQRVYLVDQAPRYRAARRTTQGSHKWLNIQRFREAGPCAEALKAQGYWIVGAALTGASITLDQIDITKPLAVVLGNEKDGLTPQMMAACDQLFYIPMVGLSQSFNVSVAAAITLHDIVRRLRARDGAQGDLSPEEQDALLEVFYRKAVTNADLILTRELGQAPPPLLEESEGMIAELVAQEAASEGIDGSAA